MLSSGDLKLVETTITPAPEFSAAAAFNYSGMVRRGDTAVVVAGAHDIAAGATSVYCCITAYNEPVEALATTLSAVAAHFDPRRFPGQRHHPSVCILFDGLPAIRAETLTVLQRLGLYTASALSGRAQLHLFQNALTAQEIAEAFSTKPSARAAGPRHLDRGEGDVRLRIMVAVKQTNRGKLDSHWWFFAALCPRIQPTYCVQMDVGTAPRPDAFAQLLNIAQSDPEVGAVASRVMVAPPRGVGDVLRMWQYGDFALQKLLEWPAEQLCGYLTVIPGQYCLFRYAALTDTADAPLRGARRTVNPTAPLDRYFRGLEELAPFEATMFLAEDRILGFEIMTQPQRHWGLRYTARAVAVTDACDDLGELLRQRRRWNNSSFMCNAWLMRRGRNFMRGGRKEWSARIRRLATIPWLTVNLAFSWLQPAFFLYGSAHAISHLCQHWRVPGPVAPSLFLAFFGSAAATVWLSFRPLTLVTRIVFGCAIAIESAIFATSLFSGDWMPIAFAVEPLAAICLATLYARALVGRVAKVTVPYTIIRPAMSFTLLVYSFCNLHNCSWGTKGLDRDPARARHDAAMRAFRSRVVLAWVTTNLIALSIAVAPPSAARTVLRDGALGSVLTLIGLRMVAGLLEGVRSRKRTSARAANGPSVEQAWTGATS